MIKKIKCSLRSFVSIKTLLVKQNDDEEFERDHYFNSIAFDVMALNNIPEIVNNIVQAYVISLERQKLALIGNLNILLNLQLYHQL